MYTTTIQQLLQRERAQLVETFWDMTAKSAQPPFEVTDANQIEWQLSENSSVSIR